MSGDAPLADWAVTIGTQGDDGTELVALQQGGVLIVTHSSDRELPTLTRITTEGQRLWEVELPERAPYFGANDNDEIVIVYDKGSAAGGTVAVRVDLQSGEFGEAVALPPAEGELWNGFEVEADTFTVMRALGPNLAHVHRYDWSGAELSTTALEFDTAGYAVVAHPDGGVVAAGVVDRAVVVRRIDQDLDESWQFEPAISLDFAQPRLRVLDVDVSPAKQVLVALSLADDLDVLDGGGAPQWFLATFDANGVPTGQVPSLTAPLGAEYVSETDFVVWRSTASGFGLARYSPDASAVWEWELSARSDYRHYGQIGRVAAGGGYLFTSGAYVGGLDLGSTRVEAVGCTDHFLARFQP